MTSDLDRAWLRELVLATRGHLQRLADIGRHRWRPPRGEVRLPRIGGAGMTRPSMHVKVVYEGPTTLDPLAIRRRLGRADWSPPRRHGPDGWTYVRTDRTGSVIVSVAEHDGHDWIHASIAWTDRMPTYDDLQLLHRAVFSDGWAYQVFAPPSEHVNIHNFALHLWGRVDRQPALPDFTGGMGSI